MLKKRSTTQSENDVHRVFIPWKIKMKLKPKLTHDQQQPRPHSNTVSIVPTNHNSNERDQHLVENLTMNSVYRYSRSTTPLVRRSLKHYPKYSTRSTSESETTTQGESLPITTTCTPIDDEKSAQIIIETTEKSS
jgi:hypothetical protein